MSRRPDLFPIPPRQAPRVLMHVADVGWDGWADFKCRKCGHVSRGRCLPEGRELADDLTVTEAKRGIPCPKCNETK